MGFSTLGSYQLGKKDRAPDYVQRPPFPEYQPTALDKFAESAGTGLGEGIQKQIANRLETSALEKALGGDFEQQSPLQQYLSLHRSGVSPEGRKGIGEIVKEHRGYGHEVGKQQLINAGKPTQQQKLDLHRAKKEIEFDIAQRKKRPSPEEQEELAGIYNDIKNVALGKNVGFSNKLGSYIGGKYHAAFSPEYQRDAERIKVLNTKMFNMVRRLEQSGHLTEGTWKQIEGTLIKPDDTRAQIEGKLEGFERLLGVKQQQSPQDAIGLQAGQTLATLPQQAAEGTRATNNATGRSMIFSNGQWIEQ